MTVQIFGATDRMRHVPPLDYLTFKVDIEFRDQIDKLYWAVYESGKPLDASRTEGIEAGFHAVCKTLERLGDHARHHRPNTHGQPQEILRSRLDHAFLQAMKGLGSIKAEEYGVRAPENHFDKSQGEALLMTMLAVGARIRKLIPLVAAVNPDIYEMLMSKLVTKQHPVNEETLKPIA